MNTIEFKNTAQRLVLELAVAVLLVGFGANLPTDISFSAAVDFITSHPNLLLHVAVGTIIVFEALVLIVRAVRSKNRAWITYAAIGLAFTLVAYGAGDAFAAQQKEIMLTVMTAGWLGALITFSVAWARNRKAK